MDSRSKILQRLSHAQTQIPKNVDDNVSSDEQHACSNIDARAQPLSSFNESEKQLALRLFTQQLEASHAQVFHLNGKDQITDKVKAVIQAHQLCKGVCASSHNPKFKEVQQQLNGIEGLQQLSSNFTKSDYFHELEYAVSYSQAVIAQTGTLVLQPGKQESRSLSLVPPLHIVIADLCQMYLSFDDFMFSFSQKLSAQSMPSNLVLVSGPSKTADIQQTLAYGAHGPQHLIVLAYNAQEEIAK